MIINFIKIILIFVIINLINGFPYNHDKSEYGDFFEGDMILDEIQLKKIMFPKGRNGLIKETYKWSNKQVFYDIDENHFNNSQINYILKALQEIELKTCLKFYHRTNQTKDYIYVTGFQQGCYSAVGHQGGKQILNLQSYDIEKGCFKLASICHEFIHALGFYHQQSSSNRDLYVKIIKENIIDGTLNNFLKYNSSVVTDYGIEYDYGSVMHYDAYAFSKNGRKTIIPLKNNVKIGQRNGMSKRDIRKLNLMYKCTRYL